MGRKVKLCVDLKSEEYTVAELRLVPGLVNFYGKFLTDLSMVLTPLYQALPYTDHNSKIKTKLPDFLFQ